MATEKQMDFFKSLHQAELDRTKNIRESSKTYITLTSIYAGFILFVAEKMPPHSVTSKILFAAAVILLLLAILAAMLVTQVATFEGLTDPDHVIAQFGDEPPLDADFFDNRIADYSIAAKRNRTVNDRKARMLATAGYLFLLGLTTHAAFFLYILNYEKR